MEKFNAFDPGMINNGIGCYIEPTLCCRRCWLPPPGAGVLVTPLAARRRSGPRNGDGGGGGSRTSLQMGASIKTTLVETQVTDDYHYCERNEMKTLEKSTFHRHNIK